jgi:hypothetical protein
MNPVNLSFKFVDYGMRLEPEPGAIVLDVGMKTVPGVIDHHHPGAEPECAASLVVKHPGLVLDHIRPGGKDPNTPLPNPLTFITHKLPDFDSLASIFLALKLLETNRVDPSMEKIAAYAKLADSARLSKRIELSQTPYAVLRALFSGSKRSEEEINKERIEEGLKFMRFLYAKSEEGQDIVENRKLFAGIDRYERAVRKIGEDYTHYLGDLGRGQILRLDLPTLDRTSRKSVDGLAISNPRSFLLKEWAWRDKENSPSGTGFGFLMICFRSSRFILGVDPDRGVNLRGLGPLLDQREREKRNAEERAAGPPWYEGDCPFFDFRIADSPQDGTSLGHKEVLDTVLAYGNGHVLESIKERS